MFSMGSWALFQFIFAQNIADAFIAAHSVHRPDFEHLKLAFFCKIQHIDIPVVVNKCSLFMF